MIPLRLELRNFLSYGEIHPPLDLEGIHVACLSGPNGHGKSALLDAMIWAMWGEARGGARAGDDLMRTGAREMEVSLTFEAGGTRYRVTRKRVARGRTGTGSLHFESLDGQQWRSLDGHSMADTQRIIDETLRMNHKTFVHASFIAQGRADAFMALSPQERKQVLGDILDLQRYDALAVAARQQAKDAQAEASRLKVLIDGIDQRLQLRAEKEARVREAEQHEREAALLHEKVAAERAILVTEVAHLKALSDQLDQKRASLHQRALQAESLATRLKELRARIKADRELMIKAGAIEQEYQEYQRLDEEARQLRSKFDAWCDANGLVQELEGQISKHREGLAAELRTTRNQLAQLAAKIEQLPADRTRLEELRAQLGGLDVAAERRVEVQRQLDAVNGQVAVLAQEGKRLKAALEEHQPRLQLLGESPVCPVCGQELGEEGLADVKRHLLDEQTRLEEALEQARADYRGEAEAARRLQEELRLLEKRLAGRAELAVAAGEVQARIKQAEADTQELDQLRVAVAQIEATLQHEEFVPEIRAQKQAAEKSLAAVGYDQERDRAVQSARDRLHGAPEALRKLERARAELATSEERQADLEAQREQVEADLASLRREVGALEDQVQHLPDLRARLEAKEEELQAVAAAHNYATEDLGKARQEVIGLEMEEADKARLAPLHRAALDEAAAYQQLAEAFGKSGIQEMIIDEALPEIEELANDLLSRLSDGRMRVQLTTQREARTGGTISTLDVNVSDELGTRPYELFSGGEKFRINFAIRIALSRMLARRSGVPLQMLAIDEGFGSQDREGCDRLIEGIRTVQNDFERILVITHLDEIKDAFPVRIEVTKTAQGSTFSVN